MPASITHRLRARVTPLTAAVVLLTTAVHADDWKTIGGNAARNGLSTETGPDAADILWQLDRSRGDPFTIIAEQPLILDEVAVTFFWPSFNQPDETFIAAYDLNTGDELWRRQLPVDPSFPGWRNRLLGAENGQIYASRSGEGAPRPDFVYALDPATGDTNWVSPERIHMTGSDTLSFAPNGDLITITYNAAEGHRLARMDKNNGDVLWKARFSGVASGSAVPVCSDVTVYMYTGGINGTRISAWDIVTGSFKYETGPESGNTQQSGPMLGPAGTLYMNRHQAFMISFTDTGAALVENWRAPMRGVAFESNAVGPDGSVYCIAPDGRYQRLDAATGAVLNTTIDPIPNLGTSVHPAVDARGRIYLHNGASSGERRLFCFTRDLQVLWEMSNVTSHRGGPALGSNGTLVVSSIGQTSMTAFRTLRSVPGDLNCDGALNGGDIDPFFLALGDPAAYLLQFPNCDPLNGDMNGDGRLDGGDIDPFFECLGAGGCP